MSRYRILIIAPFFPYPPTDGGKICVFGFIDYLRRHHEFHLYVPIRTYEEKENLEKLKKVWHDVVIYVMDETPRTSEIKKYFKRWPFIQMADLVRKIRLSRTPNEKDSYEFYLNALNTFPFAPFNLRYIRELKRILSSNQFDVIQTELTPMLNLIHLFPPQVKKVFVQIESREGILRDYANHNSIDKSFSDYIVSNAAFIEYSYMSLYDAVFTLNENDKNVIRNHCPQVKVYNSPYAILDSQFSKIDIDSYHPLHLIFMGSENHFPNYDGLRWFLTDVTPLFGGMLPKLYVTGNWQDTTKKEFTKLHANIQFTGFVEDLLPYLTNSISIVPIRIGGGGMRTKVLYSMANNVPVVATAVALVGIEGENNRHYLRADSAQEFANMITELMVDRNKAIEIIRCAEIMVKSRYSQSEAGKRRNSFYNQILEGKMSSDSK